jgi:hypothetical protein
MAHEEATKRPWAWEWGSEESITIFQPSDKLHSIEVGEVYCFDHKSDEHRLQAEHDADLIVVAVNTYDPTRHPND